jgi:hypothetical protein
VLGAIRSPRKEYEVKRLRQKVVEFGSPPAAEITQRIIDGVMVVHWW